MSTHNVNLPQGLTDFIQERIGSGRYQNASEVVRAGLRLLEQREMEDGLRLEEMRRKIEIGFEEIRQGKFYEITDENLGEFFADIDREIRDTRPR